MEAGGGPFSFFLMEENKLRFMFVTLTAPARPRREGSGWRVVLWVWAAGEGEEAVDLGPGTLGRTAESERVVTPGRRRSRRAPAIG